MTDIVIRRASAADEPDLRRAVVELQEHERRLHATRLPGEQIADAYVAWLHRQAAEKSGTMMVAECEGSFAGFVVGWVAEHDHIAVTPDANRFGYLSDICVMPAYRGRRIAHQLIAAIEQHLARRHHTTVPLDPCGEWVSSRELRARRLHALRDHLRKARRQRS
jgi:ribosomal protein S18 acetylase RimI-like enzyme